MVFHGRVPRHLEKQIRSWVRFQFTEDQQEKKVLISLTANILLPRYHVLWCVCSCYLRSSWLLVRKVDGYKIQFLLVCHLTSCLAAAVDHRVSDMAAAYTRRSIGVWARSKLWCLCALGTWQKHNVLSDAALPEEFKLALAESLQHGIFSSVRCPLFFLERFALVMTRCWRLIPDQ